MSEWCGFTRLLESTLGSPSLIILNYHRIGDGNLTPYDSGTFSSTTAEFEWQVAFLKKRFRILNLQQATDFVHNRAKLSGPAVLLTFDDGYLDNYQEAFPVLRKHGVSATFFLPTAFVGTGAIPWWDAIAFIVKGSKSTSITLTNSTSETFDLSPASRADSIVKILKLFRHPSIVDTEAFLSELETACQCDRPRESARLFLDWNEAREMQAAGMCFGSHTHSHEILTKLPYERQVKELTLSRQILEHELHTTIETLAYPVGIASTFSQDTIKALGVADYRAAFSFKGGINIPGAMQPFDVSRTGVDGEERFIFRLRVAGLAALRRGLV